MSKHLILTHVLSQLQARTVLFTSPPIIAGEEETAGCCVWLRVLRLYLLLQYTHHTAAQTPALCSCSGPRLCTFSHLLAAFVKVMRCSREIYLL